MSEDIKKGLLGIVVDKTTISQVMPDINSLTYRGYAVQDLCEKCIFEEVAYLVLNGELPNKTQLNKFKKQLEKNRNISTNLREIIKLMPKKSHPMDVARTAVSVMGLEDKETNNNSPEANMRKAMRIFAKTPTALAAFFRARKGKKIIPPKKKLTFSENFFYMCFGKIPREEIVKAFDVSLILYAEHSFNVSTFTARTITSSLSDIHGVITGAIASLKGPLHGGANEEVMNMLKIIKKPDNAKKWILNALENKKIIMGFGHRVYSKGDSRVPTMKKYYLKVAEILNEKKLPEMSQIIEDIMLEKKKYTS
jgi:2-methylcitrate synthase